MDKPNDQLREGLIGCLVVLPLNATLKRSLKKLVSLQLN